MPPLRAIISDLETGYYTVPEIQREFVWRNSQIRDLVQSLWQKFPIGSIIVWEIPAGVLTEYRDLFRPLAEDLAPSNARYMVIDGQQRLTSILLLKKGELRIGGKVRRLDLHFNPLEGRFELERGRRLRRSSTWFNVTDILQAEDILSDVVDRKAKEMEDTSIAENPVIRRTLQGLKNDLDTYDLSVIRADLSSAADFLELFEKISQIFIALNSKGTRIRLPDLVLALLTGRMRRERGESFRQKFKLIIEGLERNAWDVDEPLLARLYLAIATGETRFAQARETLDRMEASKVLAMLDAAGEAVQRATQFLRQDVGIKSTDGLRSKYALVPLSQLIYRDSIQVSRPLTEAAKNRLTEWTALAGLQGRYTGRLESELKEDTAAVAEGRGPDGLLDKLTYRSLSESVLDGEWDVSHVALLSMIYHKNAAKDWDRHSIEPRAVRDIEASELAIHHIFPKRVLQEHYAGEQSTDDVANVTLISNQANRSIGDDFPEHYLAQLGETDPEFLVRHRVPMDPSLWVVDRFDAFLQERRRLIASAVRSVLGIHLSEGEEREAPGAFR